MGEIVESLAPREQMPQLFMGWEEARQLVARGFSVQSHTCSHSVLAHETPRLPAERARRFPRAARVRLGISISTIAYPYGGQAEYSEATVAAAREAGYSWALTTREGFTTAATRRSRSAAAWSTRSAGSWTCWRSFATWRVANTREQRREDTICGPGALRRRAPSRPGDDLRLAVYCDFAYRRRDGRAYAEQAFVIFLCGLREHMDRLVLLGRLDETDERWHFALPQSVDYEPLPHYVAAVRAVSVLSGARRLGAALLARAGRGRHRLALRPQSARSAVRAACRCTRARGCAGRTAGLRGVRRASGTQGECRCTSPRALLDGAFKLLARRCAVLVVGPKLAEGYSRRAQARRDDGRR